MHRFLPPIKGPKSSRSTTSNFQQSPSQALEFPQVVTIFSAPNYQGTYDNKGAYFLLDHGLVRLKTFGDTPPPYQLPNGLNALTWSLPFMMLHVCQMQNHFLEKAAITQMRKHQAKKMKMKI